MSVVSSLSKIGEVLAIWLDPERKEKVVLKRAIEAGDELLMILRREGRYKSFPEKKLKEHELHFQKRWDKWKNGVS